MKQIKFYLTVHRNLLSKPDKPEPGVSRTHQTYDKVKKKYAYHFTMTYLDPHYICIISPNKHIQNLWFGFLGKIKSIGKENV